MARLHLLLPLVLILAACGGPRHDDTLTYQVHFGPGDVMGTTLAEDLHINPEDDFWRNFLIQSQATLGQAPTRIEVTNVRLQLIAPKSKNVSRLEDVFSGKVTAFLRANDTRAQVDIAEIEDPTGSAQVSMDTTGKDLEPLKAHLSQSDFLLGLRGSTPKQGNSDFEATVTLTLDVSAY